MYRVKLARSLKKEGETMSGVRVRSLRAMLRFPLRVASICFKGERPDSHNAPIRLAEAGRLLCPARAAGDG